MSHPRTPGPESLLGIRSADEAPADICLVAEDVLAGLDIVVRALKDSAPEDRRGPEGIEYERWLKSAGEYLVNYFEDLYRVNCVPYMDFGPGGPEEVEVDRLGILPDGDYALYDSQARLGPGARFPINYGGYHMVPAYNQMRDSLPGSQDAEQLYMGYAPSSMEDMGGYAISWNHLRILFGAGHATLGAVPKDELDQLDLAEPVKGSLGGFIRR